MANITLSSPSFFRNGDSGASAVVGYESGYNRVARYSFTAPATGATSVSLSFTSMWHGDGEVQKSFRFYIGTSSTSHTNAGASSPYTGTITADANGTNFTGTANITLSPNATYYLFVFPANTTYGWYNWNGSASMSVTGGQPSVPTVSAASVAMENSVTIYTNRKSTAFTHKITYWFGSAKGTIAESVGDSIQWIPPLSLAEQIPSAAKGYGTIYCETYSGGTKIGSTQSVAIALTVPNNASTKPTVSMTIAPDSSLGSAFNGLYIQNLTKVDADVSATGKYGASIKSYETLVGGSKYNGGYLTQTGNVTVTGKATDSRGYVGSTEKVINVIPYSKPAVLPADGQKAIICGRCNENGSYTETGTYLRIIAKRSYSTITANGVQKNFSTLRFRINGGEWQTLLSRSSSANQIDTAKIDGVTLSLTSSYSVEIGVVDDIGNSASVTFRIPTDKVDIHLREGGGGIAFGGYSTKEGFECAMPAFFTANVQATNMLGRYVTDNSAQNLYNAGISCLGKGSNAGLLLIIDTTDPSNYVFCYYHFVTSTSNIVKTISSNNMSFASNIYGTVSARDASGNEMAGKVTYVVMPCFATT